MRDEDYNRELIHAAIWRAHQERSARMRDVWPWFAAAAIVAAAMVVIAVYAA